MSQVRHIDAAGVDVLLQCMREAVKHDGDLKLAALSPQAAVVLELTRTGRLFEIYENSTAAVKSFSSFLPNAMRHFYRTASSTACCRCSARSHRRRTMPEEPDWRHEREPET